MKSKILCFLGGVFAGMIISIPLLGPYTQDAERQRAIRAKVGEYYLNDQQKLEFRFLTEHKD